MYVSVKYSEFYKYIDKKCDNQEIRNGERQIGKNTVCQVFIWDKRFGEEGRRVRKEEGAGGG